MTSEIGTGEIQKERLKYIDVMKAIGILWVISLHANVWHDDFISTNWNPSMLIQYAFRLISEGVPLFMVINGFLTFSNSSFSLEKHVRKMIRYFFLLLVWAVILTFALGITNEPLTYGLFVECIMNTWVGAKYTGVLWFLQGLLAVELVYPGLKHIFSSDKKVFYYLFAVVSFFSVGLNLLDLLLEFILVLHPSGHIPMLIPFIKRMEPVNDGVIMYVFCAMLGGVIHDRYNLIRIKRKILIFVGLVAWLTTFSLAVALSALKGYVHNRACNYGSIFMALSIIGMFALFENYRGGEKLYQKFLESIGKYSFGIYLTHFIMLRVLNDIIPQEIYDYKFLWQRLLVMFTVWIMSWIVSMVMEKIPFVRELIRT